MFMKHIILSGFLLACGPAGAACGDDRPATPQPKSPRKAVLEAGGFTGIRSVPGYPDSVRARDREGNEVVVTFDPANCRLLSVLHDRATHEE